MRRWLVLALGVVTLGTGGGVAIASTNQAGGHSTSGAPASSTRTASSTRANRSAPARRGDARASLDVTGIHKIKHVVIIMQENRSFDSYFGTFPGADGIPGLAGNPGPVPCLPDPRNGGCDPPFHDRSDINNGGPHNRLDATRDMNCRNAARRLGCRMNHFVVQAESGRLCTGTNPQCSPCTKGSSRACLDVVGYHDGSDIPNYWSYAHDYVLQDHMFQSVLSWSLPQHLFMVSEWSAKCGATAMSCVNDPGTPPEPIGYGHPPATVAPHYRWTDLTYLLYRAHVSWRYYVFTGTQPDCVQDQQITCQPVHQNAKTPGIWNPLLWFSTVHQDRQLNNIQSLSHFFAAARQGSLPAVSWVIPTKAVSEHPPNLVSMGQSYVTGLVNAVMQSPDWESTAIFLAWDDWGGFYDNAVPPAADVNGYGLRVPAMVISPYAKPGYIDHQTLSFDAYNKFIEDDFLGGQRLNPRTDGRFDPRPNVPESNHSLGNLSKDFNFSQRPRPPIILPTCPATDLKPPPHC